MVHSPLTTGFAITSDYSSRGGVKVDSIGHHHAASTSLAGTLALFQPGGRTVSPNYCIKDDQIILVVPEEYRAWTTGSARDDSRSITYEICNDSGDPDWRISEASYRSVMALDADIARRYGIPLQHGIPGFWEHRNIYQWFGRSYATACAGPGFDINRVIYGTAAVAALGVRLIDSDPFIKARESESSMYVRLDPNKYPDSAHVVYEVWRNPATGKREFYVIAGKYDAAAALNLAVPCDAETLYRMGQDAGYVFGTADPEVLTARAS